MPGESKIEYASLSEIYLDSRNPRLGRRAHELNLSQDEVLDLMRAWSLEELATSFLESGFWPHEAVLCAVEEINGEDRLVAIEGNRRVAALKFLKKACDGEKQPKKWRELIAGVDKPTAIFDSVPFIRLDKRSDADTFLGFRHVTGIKEWAPPEKAQFIAKLVDEKGLSYRDVMRKIGSRTDVVKRNYIAYCILTQMEQIEDLEVEEVENRFSVLFLSLRSMHVRAFLGVEGKFESEPAEVKPPVDEGHVDKLKEYSLWLFGDGQTLPIVKDSREVDKFAHVLASEEGLAYLRSVRNPSLDSAFVIAGGEQDEIYERVSTAAYNLQEALSSIHLYKGDKRLIKISELLIAHANQIKIALGI